MYIARSVYDARDSFIYEFTYERNLQQKMVHLLRIFFSSFSLPKRKKLKPTLSYNTFQNIFFSKSAKLVGSIYIVFLYADLGERVSIPNLDPWLVTPTVFNF